MKLGFGFGSAASIFSGTGRAGCGFNGRVKSFEIFIDLRGGIGGASWSCITLLPRSIGESFDDTSISGTLLMLVVDEDDEELPDEDVELAEDGDEMIGGGFEAFPFTTGFDDDPLASFSCDSEDVKGIGVFLTNFGDVCGL